MPWPVKPSILSYAEPSLSSSQLLPRLLFHSEFPNKNLFAFLDSLVSTHVSSVSPFSINHPAVLWSSTADSE